MLFKVALLTASVAVPFWPAKTAVIVVLPGVMPVATPAVSIALLTVATEGADEVQLTAAVRSRLWPSVKIPVAFN